MKVARGEEACLLQGEQRRMHTGIRRCLLEEEICFVSESLPVEHARVPHDPDSLSDGPWKLRLGGSLSESLFIHKQETL